VAGSLARLLEEDVESTGSPPPPSPPSDDASGDPQGPGQGSGGGRGRGQCLDKLIDEEDEELREWDEALLEGKLSVGFEFCSNILFSLWKTPIMVQVKQLQARIFDLKQLKACFFRCKWQIV